MSKGLEALKEIKHFTEPFSDFKDFGKHYKIIEKEIKALEIIKNKRVDVTFFDDYIKWNWDKYQKRKLKCSKIELTKKEFDLLKEVLL